MSRGSREVSLYEPSFMNSLYERSTVPPVRSSSSPTVYVVLNGCLPTATLAETLCTKVVVVVVVVVAGAFTSTVSSAYAVEPDFV